MRAYLSGILSWRAWARRTMFVAGAHLRARLAGATLDLVVDPDSLIESGVSLYIEPRSRNRIVLAKGARVEQGVYLELKGGTIEIGPGSLIRRGCILKVSGHLCLEGNNVVSYGTAIHCASSVHLAWQASCSEYVTFADGRHFFTDATTHFYDNAEAAPIRVGRNTWVANKASVLMGVTIGDHCVVAGHAVVSRDVPDRTMVGGIPAKPLGPVVFRDDDHPNPLAADDA